MELYEKSAAELGRMLRAKEASAAEITESVLGRIAQVEPRVGAYLTLTEETARSQAARVDEKLAKGEALAPLAGIPLAVKDNISTKDVLTTCASKILYNYVPSFDAFAYARAMEQGMVLLGKVNMDEFAMGSSCENSAMKTTRNPHNPDYVPGGSSGGSAAAVAACEAVLALGSDTGGSIRQPAAYCGVVGLKPTYGSVSRYGLVAFASSLDQIGPVARTVEDAALLFEAIAGRDPMDATSIPHDYTGLAAGIHAPVQGMTIGLPKEYFGEGVEEETRAAVLAAADALKAQGVTVKEISLPSTPYGLAAYYIISSAEASSNLARFDGVKYGYRTPEYSSLTEMYEKTRSEGFGDEVKRRIMLGTFVLSSGYYDAYYKRAKLMQNRIAAEFAEAFAGCDAILAPTAPGTAFRLGENYDNPLKMYAADVCTVNINIAGLPAVSIPCVTGKNGLPIGMQLIGAKFEEAKILRLAAAYESLCGGFAPAAIVD